MDCCTFWTRCWFLEGIVRNSEFELPPVNMHIVMELMETQGSGPHRELPRNGRARLGEVHYQQPCDLLPSFFPVCRSRLQQTPRHRFAFLGSPAPVKAYLPWRSLHRIVQHDSARHIECLVPLRNVHCIVPLCLEETKEFASELLVAVHMVLLYEGPLTVKTF